MIKSFKDKETIKIFYRNFSKSLPQNIQRNAYRKLLMLDEAKNINDLRNPPGNHLEQLKGQRAGRYSIKINKQWRICFKWIENSAHEVEIIDYH